MGWCCSEARGIYRRGAVYIPVIIVTAKGEEVDKIVGLELGADDYITEPFNTRELLARIRAVLRLVRSRRNASHREYLPQGAAGRCKGSGIPSFAATRIAELPPAPAWG